MYSYFYSFLEILNFTHWKHMYEEENKKYLQLKSFVEKLMLANTELLDEVKDL